MTAEITRLSAGSSERHGQRLPPLRRPCLLSVKLSPTASPNTATGGGSLLSVQRTTDLTTAASAREPQRVVVDLLPIRELRDHRNRPCKEILDRNGFDGVLAEPLVAGHRVEVVGVVSARITRSLSIRFALRGDVLVVGVARRANKVAEELG
jgi:hypothetical protein